MPYSEELDSIPGLPGLASVRSHVGTRTNPGSRIDYITQKPDLHYQLGMRSRVSASRVSGCLFDTLVYEKYLFWGEKTHYLLVRIF